MFPKTIIIKFFQALQSILHINSEIFYLLDTIIINHNLQYKNINHLFKIFELVQMYTKLKVSSITFLHFLF